jgi:hypothetical protein
MYIYYTLLDADNLLYTSLLKDLGTGSVAERHHFDAALAPGKNFYAFRLLPFYRQYWVLRILI